MPDESNGFKLNFLDKAVRFTAMFFIIKEALKFINPQAEDLKVEVLKDSTPNNTELHLTPEMIKKLTSDTSRNTYIGPATEVRLTDTATVKEAAIGIHRKQ